MKNKITKLFAAISLIGLTTVNSSGVVWALTYTAPTPPPLPTPYVAPTPPPAPTWEEFIKQHEEAVITATAPEPTLVPLATPTPTPVPTPTPTPTATSLPSPSPSYEPIVTSAAATTELINDPLIQTGDSTINALVNNQVNQNQANSDGVGLNDSAVTNENNGAMSDNQMEVVETQSGLTVENNSAAVVTDFAADNITGENDNSYNWGKTTTKTGEANTLVTVVTAANTNLDGVQALEFDIVDDYVGDIVLDFGTPCQSGGCQSGQVDVLNDGNGAFSENAADVTSVDNQTAFAINDANVENNIILAANSGDNNNNYNTGGDNQIETGDANIVASVANFLNNNLQGNVMFATVNIMADLVGDIVVPKGTATQPVNVINEGNGALSDNDLAFNSTASDQIYQQNFANIDNNVEVVTTTGDNETNYNTASRNDSGQNSIETGESNVDVNVVNIANQNLAGGDWWIVLVNEMGQWVGKIVGAADGANMAGSYGTEFIQNPDGSIDIINTGNGALSDNSVNQQSVDNSLLSQTNNASLTNNISLAANTGGNKTNFNTGGSNTINTGDANVMLDLVNFVNNNIAGGNIFVTVVNVFGSWQGNFVPPDEAKQVPLPPIGGVNTDPGPLSDSDIPNPSATTNPVVVTQENTGSQATNTNHDPVDSDHPVAMQTTTQSVNLSAKAMDGREDNQPGSIKKNTLGMRTPAVLGTTMFLTEKFEDDLADKLWESNHRPNKPGRINVTLAWPTVISTIIGLAYTAMKTRPILVG